jgi:hypothetical protein
LAPLGVNGAALAAWDENVDFLALFGCCRADGVNEGESALNAFLFALITELLELGNVV